MSISHWGIVPGCWWVRNFGRPDEDEGWRPLDFATWCIYWHGTENET